MAGQDIAFARQFFRTVLGLEEKTIENVIREIRAQAGFTALKTPIIRNRIGAQAMRLMRTGMQQAKEKVGDEDDDESEMGDQEQDETETGNEMDRMSGGSPADRMKEGAGDRKRPKGKSLREDIAKDASKRSLGQPRPLKEFLLDVDPENPDEAINDVRRMIAMANRPGGEERLARQLVAKADEERNRAREAENTPINNVSQQIARLKQQIAYLERRRASLERRQEEETGEQQNESVRLDEEKRPSERVNEN